MLLLINSIADLHLHCLAFMSFNKKINYLDFAATYNLYHNTKNEFRIASDETQLFSIEMVFESLHRPIDVPIRSLHQLRTNY